MSLIPFKRLYHISDVTVVKFAGEYVFAGIGGILKIFRIGRVTCVKEEEIFKGHQIHGIELLEGERLIIHGAKQVVVISPIIDENKISLEIEASLDLEDWILCTHWLSRNKKLAIVTAHNVVWLWSWQNNIFDLRCIKCTEKCILYAASMCGEECEDSTVFCGTVFREIILWIPSLSHHGDQTVLHRLKGHNGVIFSISWNPTSSLLCSTSDDRSVRTWKVTFGVEKNWSSSSVEPLHVFYGHSARVWNSLILHDTIVSCGEDSRICVWSCNGSLLHKWERNISGCIWSLDYSEQLQLLVAGGGDGSVQLYPLSIPVLSPGTTCLWRPEHLIGHSDCIRKLCILQSGAVIAVTDGGTLLKCHCDQQNSWKVIHQDNRFANYCILSTSCDKSHCSMASLNGDVVVYQDSNMNCCLDEKIEDGRILALVWLSNDEFLTCVDQGRLTVWKIVCNEEESKAKFMASFILPFARERWPTAAVTLKVDCKKFLICGDRCGSLHLFKFKMEDERIFEPPHHSLFKVHGRLGVSTISQVGDDEFLSTGRDGILRYFRIRQSQVHLISSEKMVMDWVAHVLGSHSNQSNVFIVGFREKNMVIWCARQRSVILDIDCGGGHRSWDCIILNEEKLEVAFVRDKQVHAGTWLLRDLMQPSLQQGMLANEINCILHLASSPTVLAFGGEDGTVKVAQLSCDSSFLKSTIALNTHISSIRCLIKHGSIFFSAGGRAQLKAWILAKDGVGGSLSCTELASFMLRGDRSQNPRTRFCTPAVDPEMRFMDICCISFGDDNLTLVSACSDGVLRFFHFNTSSCVFSLTGESTFHQRCILKVSSISLPRGRIFVLSAATDGIVALWSVCKDLQSEPIREPLWCKRFHQSGVNSIHAYIFQSCIEPIVLVASGGDDNALVLFALLIKDSSPQVSVYAQWQSTSAHAAQITGVWIVNNWLISTSIDQRLTLWQWNLNTSEPNSLTCKFIKQCVCHVPDIQHMQVWEESQGLVVCVAGKGVEILQLDIQ